MRSSAQKWNCLRLCVIARSNFELFFVKNVSIMVFSIISVYSGVSIPRFAVKVVNPKHEAHAADCFLSVLFTYLSTN